ncbi:MAG TPA: AAA family ATPase [Pseudonocardiaceae bacterium]|nr:AAA family ATPase [Pseudonocardiaceae bacterium]
MGLVLRAVDLAGPCRWRWLLIDEQSGVRLADHLVNLEPDAAETEAFADLYRFLRWRADPERRVSSEAALVHRMGAWIGSVVLGERIGRAIATTAPVTVRVQVPPGAEFLAFRPIELAHAGGMPLAARGDVALVYELAGSARAAKAGVGDALRVLAVFSLPTATSALALRRERYRLSRLLPRVAARSRRRVELQVAQYGLTRAVLADLARSGGGWDVLHLSGLGGMGEFLLENPDGSLDPVSSMELVGLLRPLRSRLKLAVVSACQSVPAPTVATLGLGVADPAAELEAQGAQEAASSVGMARALLADLGCAVIAMRYPVVDDFATGFAEVLYDRMFRNAQPVDRAVSAAVSAAAGPAPSLTRPAICLASPAILGAAATRLSLEPPIGKPVPDPAEQVMAHFPAEPLHFVGRVEAMAAASAALAPASGRAAVVLHGMAGAGKTVCALELAYRHQPAFEALAFWSAPTDPDQYGDALRLLAVALDAQLASYRLAMADTLAAPEQLKNFLPTLTAVLADARLLLVLDTLDVLLTPDGQWRDPRWALLIGALTGHAGYSRVVLASRIVPAGLDLDTVLVQRVHALSRAETLLLARELPNLAGIEDPVLGRRVLTLIQGHPTLLELADAAVADPNWQAVQLEAIEAMVDTAALPAFCTAGETGLDAEQLWQILTAWTTHLATALPAPARLLLQTLCRIEESDRSSALLGGIWTALWRRLDQPGEPPPLAQGAAALVATGLVAIDSIKAPVASDGPVRYRIHRGVAEVIHAATAEPVTAGIDAQLAAWWIVVSEWGIEQDKAGKDTHRLVLDASLAAARYLMRQQDWDAASCLLERALLRDHYATGTALLVIPSLRRIAEATGARKDLVVLAAALRKLDPGEAEMLLRRAYEQAVTDGEYRLASATAGDLVALLRDQGRLREALRLAGQKIEHTIQAGLGLWTQLSDQGRRLQLLGMLGHHEQVLAELPALRARMTTLTDEPADNDQVNPGNVREGLLDVGRCSAMAVARWAEALELGEEITGLKRRRGASPYETARTCFNNYLPLLRLDRLADVDQLLRDCQEVFDTSGDITQLAVVYAARAALEDQRDHPGDAVDLQRTSLRLRYLRPDPQEIAAAHHHLANYLSRACDSPVEQRAHRLAAALLNHLTGDTTELTRTLGVLAGELRSDPDGPDAATLPRALAEVIALVEADAGVRLGNLVAALCPGRSTTEHALADLLATAATSAAQQADHAPVDVNHLLAAWGPVISAVGAAARDGDIPAELTDLLDELATTDWVALVAALRRVLAGERGREHLLAGLDHIGTAILAATLDHLTPAACGTSSACLNSPARTGSTGQEQW